MAQADIESVLLDEERVRAGVEKLAARIARRSLPWLTGTLRKSSSPPTAFSVSACMSS